MAATDRDVSTICLFDVDGTLTKPRIKITPEMEEFMQTLQKKVLVGLVGGSDLNKINEQMSSGTEHVTERYEYVFSENGLVAHSHGKLTSQQSIQAHLGEDKTQKFINYALKLLSQIELPVKRGTFIEFRTGLINVCPVGRSCSQGERDQFAAFDMEHNIRKFMVQMFEKEFAKDGLKFVIGGQISIDVFPEGWDKRFALKHLEGKGIRTYHFFGDKTMPGGNDHELYEDPKTIGHTVTSPEDTRKQVQELFFKD